MDGKRLIDDAQTQRDVDNALELTINIIDQIYVKEFYPDDELRLHILDLYVDIFRI